MASASLRPIVLSSLLGVLAAGCYEGSARDAEAERIGSERGWALALVPLVPQAGASDCGPAALASVLAYWDRATPVADIRAAVGTSSGGTTAGALAEYARGRGLEAHVFPGEVSDLTHELAAGRPVIVGVIEPYSPGKGLAHFEVVTGVNEGRQRVLLADPARGLREDDVRGFLAAWTAAGRVALVLYATEQPIADPRPEATNVGR